MWSAVASVFATLMNWTYEVLIYAFVDFVVKVSLRDARDEQEKRNIWQYESLFLFGISVLMFFHHWPYILMLLSLCTFLYSQLVGRDNFRRWWFQLATRWDEFQQMEESLEHYHEMQSRQFNNSQQPPPNVQVTMAPTHTQHWMPQQQHFSGEQSPQVDSFRSEAWYPADSEKSKGRFNATPSPVKLNGPVNSMPVPVQHSQPPSGVRQRMPPVGNTQQMPLPIYSSPPPMTRYPPFLPRPDLARRPIHSYRPSNDAPQNVSSFKSKVLSAFGMQNESTGPVGLKNYGKNLCFLNSVLQCLGYSPGFAECLFQNLMSMRCSSNDADFVIAVSELFGKLKQKSKDLGVNSIDTDNVRAAASQLNGSIIVDPENGVQEQQDAAEYLMWMLDILHSALNVEHLRHENLGQHQQGDGGAPRYPNIALNMLKFIYGDLTPQRVEELKSACRKEIEQANGVDNETYAEPIQRLSDLEWLSYKGQNCSFIDDMFTGQLVEAQHCLACNRVTVGIQTFNILPVPIVEPRQLNGLVYLEDCFAKFGHIEDLFGPDGLKCENCNKGVVVTSRGKDHADTQPSQRMDIDNECVTPVMPNGSRHKDPNALNALRRRQLLTSDSAVGSSVGSPCTPQTFMSPIPNSGDVFNDSGFHDNHIRTSTPISHAPSAVRYTDGQRRSLLRQLPECLIVQLMRFSVIQGSPQKLKRSVAIPPHNLDLTHLIIDNVMRREDLTALHTSFKYSLYSLCLHLGGDSTNYGHYIAYVKGVDGCWYRCDDESVQSVNMDYELSTRQVRENAYLLFYRKTVGGPT